MKMCSVTTFLKKKKNKSLKANKRKGRCLNGRFKREGPSSRGGAAGFFRLCVNHGSPEVCRAGGSIGVRAVGGNQHRLFKASEGRGQGRAPASAPGGRLQGALGIQRQELVVVLGGGGTSRSLGACEQQSVRKRKTCSGFRSIHLSRGRGGWLG